MPMVAEKKTADTDNFGVPLKADIFAIKPGYASVCCSQQLGPLHLEPTPPQGRAAPAVRPSARLGRD